MTANNRRRNDLIVRASTSDVISIACEPKRHHRSRHHPMYILDTPTRTNPTPTLSILGSTGNVYQMVITRSSITCSCPDNHTGCKHILALLHLTTTSHRRGNYIHVTPSYLIDKIQNGTLLQSNYLKHLPNRICSQNLQTTDCEICSFPISGTISTCSKCLFSHHLRCPLPRHTSTCPRCNSILLTSFIVGDSYRNYSSVLNHFQYPVRTATPPHMPPLPPLRPPFDNQPPLQPDPDNILSGAIIPPSPTGNGPHVRST